MLIDSVIGTRQRSVLSLPFLSQLNSMPVGDEPRLEQHHYSFVLPLVSSLIRSTCQGDPIDCWVNIIPSLFARHRRPDNKLNPVPNDFSGTCSIQSILRSLHR